MHLTTRGSWQRKLPAIVASVVLVLAGWATLVSAQDYAPGLLMIVVPDSVRPLAFGLDSLGPPTTSYPCLDSVNSSWAYINVFKAHPHSKNLRDGIYVVQLPDSTDLDSALSAYLMSGCFDDAYKVGLVEWEAVPNDSLWSGQWALNETHTRINQAWDITKGDSDIVVAIVDQGLFWEHPDLANSVWINDAEDINNNGTFECWASTEQRNGVFGDLDSFDNDSNGYVDDVVGMKFLELGGTSPNVTLFRDEILVQYDSTPMPHGSMVASILAAQANNGTGLAGAAGGWHPKRGVRLMAAIPQGGASYLLHNAVEYAINAGADIINMSFTLPGYSVQELRILDTLLYRAFYDSNMICVAAAGNGSSETPVFPAAFGETYYEAPPADPPPPDSDRIIGVGSLDSLNSKCTTSNYGRTLYDFGAPGWNWTACVEGIRGAVVYGYGWSGDCSRYISGCATSWATPIVSAAAALVWSAFPELSNAQIIRRLRGSDPGNQNFKSGNIDAFNPMVWWPTPVWTGTLPLYGDVVVPANETLTVDLGTQVMLPGGDFANKGTNTSKVEIIVNGTLVARGTDSLPITFRADPSAGYDKWAGIRVQNGGKLILDHVIIKDAICGVTFDSAGVCSLRNVTINHCQSSGIDIASENVAIRGSRISDIQNGYGIRMDSGAKVNLYGDTISHAYGGIEFYPTRPCSLYACLIESCDVQGIYTQSDSVYIDWSTIVGCPYGIYGENSNVHLYRTYIHQHSCGVHLDEGSGGVIAYSRIGDGLDAGIGLTLQGASLYMYQTKVDGPSASVAVSLNGTGGCPVFHECKIDGRGSGHTGIFGFYASGPELRCSQVVGFTYRDILSNRSDMYLGVDQSGEHGNNTFDTLADVTIQSIFKSIKAERNYFWCAPDTTDCQDSVCGSPPTFSGQVDYTPWLSCGPDSCSFAEWDTTTPPCCGNNRVAPTVPVPQEITTQNYPNPFNPTTVIRYMLQKAGDVEISIYNVLGQQVRALVDETQQAGPHEVIWDGKNRHGDLVPSGVYFYRIRAGSHVQTKKMVVLR